MKNLLITILLLISFAPVSAQGSQSTSTEPAEQHQPAWMQKSRQMVVVTSPDWKSQNGTLYWYERTGNDAWQEIGGPFAVLLGRAGQGWGLGLHPVDAAMPNEPLKVEGDKRSPAGIFTLPYAFAYDPKQIAGTAMDVLDVEPDLFCVDDAEASQYNTVTRLLPGQAAPWKSAEDMQRPDGLYAFGIFVGHNQNPPVPGRGSCIILHIAKRDGSPTTGCTSMDESTVRALIRWLTPSAFPVLVQLPQKAYERLQKSWELP